jgi:hypothetical protein
MPGHAPISVGLTCDAATGSTPGRVLFSVTGRPQSPGTSTHGVVGLLAYAVR